jgi:heme exporter protein C
MRWFSAAALVLVAAGLVVGLLIAPTDPDQGDAYRIVFIHGPAASISALVYGVMAFWAGAGLMMNTPMSAMLASALAPTGALMAFVALWTGAMWGRPTVGQWWVWNAQLTSELLLLFLYFSFIALQAAIDDPRRADRSGAVIALVGVVNAPVLYFSVQWWSSMHQGPATAPRTGPVAASTFIGLALMVAAFWAYAVAAAMHRLRSIILEREKSQDWVRHLSSDAK